MTCSACQSPNPIYQAGCPDCEGRAFMGLQGLHPHEERCPGSPDEPVCSVCVRRLQIERDKSMRYTPGPGLAMSPPIHGGICVHHIEFRMPL